MFGFLANNTIDSIRRCFGNRYFMLSLLICVVWASKLLLYIRGVVNQIPVACNYTDELEFSLIILIIVLSLPALLARLTIADYSFYIGCLFVYGLNFLFFTDNFDPLCENAFTCLCLVFPCYFIGRIIEPEKFFTVFVWLAGICIVMDLFYFIIYVQNMKSLKDAQSILSFDNMYSAYQLLPHVLIMAWSAMRKFNPITLVLTVVGLLLLLSFGSRGPLACAGLFLIVYFLFFMRFRYSKYVKTGIVGLGILTLFFQKGIAIFLKTVFEEMNLSTRIIDRILGGGLTHDTGRSWLTDKLYAILDKNGDFFGCGLFGSQRYGIVYSHSFVCDVHVSFGYCVGTFLLIAFMLVLVAGFWTCKNKMDMAFILLLFCAGVAKLFLSSTFLFEPLFFMLIGFCVANIARYERNKENTCL